MCLEYMPTIIFNLCHGYLFQLFPWTCVTDWLTEAEQKCRLCKEGVGRVREDRRKEKGEVYVYCREQSEGEKKRRK